MRVSSITAAAGYQTGIVLRRRRARKSASGSTLSGDPQQLLEVIGGGSPVLPLQPAFETAVDDPIVAPLAPHRYRLHQPTALRLSVSGMDIDVLGPEAGRAVIGKPAADDPHPAPFAFEVLDGALEAAALVVALGAGHEFTSRMV